MEVPPALVEQLKPGGRMVIPVDSAPGEQILRVIEKDSSGSVRSRDVIPVRFVPLREK
jgi:protein-L-isoaspartate(D-aspartate) O-methyltransferase